MKKLIFVICFLITSNLFAQTDYVKQMEKAFTLWETKPMESAQIFERITGVEKQKWLPPYYAANIYIIQSFGLQDEAKLESQLTKAQEYLNIASKISPKNPEIIIMQALLNTAYIAFDGQKYGMTLAPENTQLYQEALQIAPDNPRVVLGKAEWEIGSAQFFGNSIKPYLKDIERAVELFKKEQPKEKFYPTYGLERAESILKKYQ